MQFKTILYGNNYKHLAALDTMLRCFNGIDFIPNKLIYQGAQKLPNHDEVLTKLLKDGLIDITSSGVWITLPGKMKIQSGGFLRETLIKRLARIGVAIGVIASAFTVIQYFRS